MSLRKVFSKLNVKLEMGFVVDVNCDYDDDYVVINVKTIDGGFYYSGKSIKFRN